MSLRAISDSSKSKSLSPLCWITVLLGFIGTFFLGTLNNDFPFYYHVDEPGKARQILTHERNLHHPLLMLNAAEALSKGLSTPQDPQSIVELGRYTSAFYSAASVAMLIFLLASYYGTTIAAIGGFIAATHWNIFELAHYFKEDPSLSFGIMSAFLGLHFYLKRSHLPTAAFWGVTLALAASGKYIGIIALILLPLGFYKNQTFKYRWLKHLAALALGFAVTYLVINWQMLTSPDTLQASLNKETQGVLEGGQIATKSFFHFGFYNRFYQVARVAAIPGVVLLLVFGWRRIHKQSRVMLALVAFPLFLATVLGFSQKDSGRYYLPAVYGVCAMSALGWKFWLDWWMMRSSKNWPKYLTMALILVTLVGALERLSDYYLGFKQGTRETLAVWVEKNLPQDAVIAQSYATKLPDPSLEERGSRPALFSQKLITIKDLQEKTTIEELKAQGVTHLAATETEWKVFLKSGKVREGKSEKFESTRSFWKTLWKDNEALLDLPAGKVGTHNPPMKLWKLP